MQVHDEWIGTTHLTLNATNTFTFEQDEYTTANFTTKLKSRIFVIDECTFRTFFLIILLTHVTSIWKNDGKTSVSYTHLTLPTIYSV